MSRKEFKRIRKKYGTPPGTELKMLGPATSPVKAGTDECAYLRDGRCSVYDLRPKVCQLYGEVPQMPCMYLFPEKALREVGKLLKG
jgi:Fe-S-cluster containining protein